LRRPYRFAGNTSCMAATSSSRTLRPRGRSAAARSIS
jgi:hypothetical protein